jgi:hypothetical protein
MALAALMGITAFMALIIAIAKLVAWIEDEYSERAALTVFLIIVTILVLILTTIACYYDAK